jgi:hypothetical protein
MKAVSNEYKNEIKQLGKQIDAYIITSESAIFPSDTINSITLHYEGSILKSVMKQLDIETTEDIPVGTNFECFFGVLVDNEYEDISLGNFIVYSSEKQEDSNSYKLVCYDKLLNSMKEYNHIDITYPITIRDYISRICQELHIPSVLCH